MSEGRVLGYAKVDVADQEKGLSKRIGLKRCAEEGGYVQVSFGWEVAEYDEEDTIKEEMR